MTVPGSLRRTSRSVVLKIGGREIQDARALRSVATWASAWARQGARVVVVHGGGEEVTAWAERFGLPTVKVAGQRVTTPALLPIVEAVLSGPVNLRVVSALREQGLEPWGTSGAASGLVHAELAGDPPGSLGQVGTPTRVDHRRLGPLLRAGLTPVLAPLALGPVGDVLNVNADLMAGALAQALRADLVLVTDVEAVHDHRGRPLDRLTSTEAQALVHTGVANGGMVPKITGALSALAGGARSVWIGSVDPASGPSAGTWFSTGVTSLPLLPGVQAGRAET